MSLTHKQERMRKQNSVGHLNCTERKVVLKRQIEFIGPKTKRQLMREGLSTRVRELRARLDHFKELGRKQHRESRYATEITYLTPLELAALDQPGSVFRLQ